MRRAFPYVATLIVLLIVAGIFLLRPTPFIGVTSDAMAASLKGAAPIASVECDEAAENEWTCDTTAAGPGQDRSYDVTINGFGCWTATPAAGSPEVGTPATLSGCITILDH